VKPARKAMWASVAGVLKVGFWVVVLTAVLIMWQVRDVTQSDNRDAVVPAEVRPSGR
jgi:hypothetical protein